jgi:hypothetical protein
MIAARNPAMKTLQHQSSHNNGINHSHTTGDQLKLHEPTRSEPPNTDTPRRIDAGRSRRTHPRSSLRGPPPSEPDA